MKPKREKIIDGVDIKNCKRRIGKDNYCRYYKRPCAENNYNCIWKKYLRKEQELQEAMDNYVQLDLQRVKEYNELVDLYKAKEQECEELKKGCSELTDIVSPYMDDFTGYNEELGGFDIVLCVKELMGQLKVENDKYSFFVDKLCEYAGLECDDEEQAMRTLSDLARQMNKAIWIIDRYKQTLADIKEIAETAAKCLYATESDDYTDGYRWLGSIILQKISECEGNNDMENN